MIGGLTFAAPNCYCGRLSKVCHTRPAYGPGLIRFSDIGKGGKNGPRRKNGEGRKMRSRKTTQARKIFEASDFHGIRLQIHRPRFFSLSFIYDFKTGPLRLRRSIDIPGFINRRETSMRTIKIISWAINGIQYRPEPRSQGG